MATITSLFESTTSNASVTTRAHDVLSGTQLCRDRFGYRQPSIFNTLTCALCFTYVFRTYDVKLDFRTYGLVTGNNTAYPEGTRLDTDINNSVSVKKVCGLLQDSSECWKWLECCKQARACCQRQIRGEINSSAVDACPGTWDGYACWPQTSVGQQPSIYCPAFVPLARTDRQAYKTCTVNATWFVNPKSNKEWTDYSDCFTKDHYYRLYHAILGCDVITVILLIPACIIFLYYRPLRQQHRIRLHLCLMASSFLTTVCSLLWEHLLLREILYTEKLGHEIEFSKSIACRLLLLLTRYAEQATFMWMFTEGFHLHRLLVCAFSVPKTLFPYYIFGFGFPLLPVSMYAIFRTNSPTLNQECWIEPAVGYDWIIAAPSLIALCANIIFLIRIVYIMVRQLEPHPNEPCSFRRAVKAVVVLMPLFGVQFLVFIYRPDVTDNLTEVYELLGKIFTYLQGSFIAIVFCFCNKEVQGYLKTSFMRTFRSNGRQENQWRSLTISSHIPPEPSRTRMWNGSSDSQRMIPLQEVDHTCPSDTDDRKTEDSVKNGGTNAVSETMEEEFLLYQK
ncbi:hypothetical protein BsWGS_04739 [Bradybaena similaris]